MAPSSLLEVGALKPDNYASCQTWIDVTPIDLHAQHPDIREHDFLLMHPEEHRERWDVISLSLVVNFVPEARDRGGLTLPSRTNRWADEIAHRANASFNPLNAPSRGPPLPCCKAMSLPCANAD